MLLLVAAVLFGLLAPSAVGAASGLSASSVIADQKASAKVIVVLRDQFLRDPAAARFTVTRTRLEAADRASLLAGVAKSGGRVTREYRTLNAFSATVSPSEAAILAADPAVAQVVPDVDIKYGPPAEPAAPTPSIQEPAVSSGQLCPTSPSKPLLEPEGLELTHTAFADRSVPQAQNLATGKGVTIGFLADGLDVSNPDLIRADGSHVIVDYRDFTGEGLDSPTDGAEAFGDASTLAAQGRQVYDLSTFVNAAHPLPAGCTITVRGVAPDASLVAIKVAGTYEFSDSALLQGLDWAVSVDHVNVLSESFGDSEIPDTARDLLRQFNEQATAAGVTVVEGTGDWGPGNTIFSAASDPSVLSVGSTTSPQLLAQTTAEGAQFATQGWLDNNPSAFSSSGFTQQGRTLDLVAPGDWSWSLCSPDPLYAACVDNNGNPSSLQTFAGTSNSTPFVAGAAALVIQAYRDSHHGASPSPALVRRLIMGTADDLDLPSSVQGAGLLDTLAAVQAARSVHTSDGPGIPSGDGLVADTDQVDESAPAGTVQQVAVSVTNTGAFTQVLSPHLRSLGPPDSDTSGTLAIDQATSPTFLDGLGNSNSYATTVFPVSPGQDDLRVQIAWPDPNAIVSVTLIDPRGRLAAVSEAINPGDYGRVDVREPSAGNWTAIVWTATGSDGYDGPVNYEIATSRLVPVAGVSPQQATVAPGASVTFSVAAQMAAQPGDAGEDLEIDSSAGRDTIVPIVLRSLAPLGSAIAHFSGTLDGGADGLEGVPAYQQTYSFNVPNMAPSLSVGMTLAGDPDEQVEGYLIDPQGNVISQAGNVRSDSEGNITYTSTLQTNHVNPIPGRWTFVAWVLGAVAGTATSIPFSANVSLTAQPTQSQGVPSGATIRAGQSASGRVTITNTGIAPESVFLDPRLNSYVNALLVPQTQASGLTLPLSLSSTEVPPQWVVPTETQTVTAAVQATAPVTFVLSPGFDNDENDLTGDPLAAATSTGHTAAVKISSDELEPGPWLLDPSLIGPFVSTASETANAGLVADTRAFDPTVTSAVGDLWLPYTNPAAPAGAPVTIAPGQSTTIPVTFTAGGPRGTTVSGTLFVDDWSYANTTGDELAAIPYTYRIG
jgi:hypothetical protein